jgi:hypothetical protein
MTNRRHRTLEVIALAILILTLVGRLPSYSYVRVSGPEGTTVIEYSGPGPHTVQVAGPDGAVAKSGAW